MIMKNINLKLLIVLLLTILSSQIFAKGKTREREVVLKAEYNQEMVVTSDEIEMD